MTDCRKQVVGRFAPSPTGLLHIGSLATAVASYLMAKSSGGRWLVRLDDLDRQRQVAGCADDILRTLELFGLHWDGEVSRQSDNLSAYEDAFIRLQQAGVIYPCGCSRKDIAGCGSAPHGEEGFIYPGLCRNGIRGGAPVRSWRLRVPSEPICFTDVHAGNICQDLLQVCGDFAVRRGDGEFAYQLAVVVDDALSGVNQVVRGADLLASTPRQLYLQQLLEIAPPEYCHVPLVTGADGAKLSKRDNLVSYQASGMAGHVERVLLHLFRFLGMMPPEELAGYQVADIVNWGVEHFAVACLPPTGGRINYLG